MRQKKTEIQQINFAIIFIYSLLTIILLAAYILEFVKDSRSIEYTLIFSVLDVVPYLLCLLIYIRNKKATPLKYFFSAGFSVLYAFVLLTAAVPTTFVYIFLVFIMIIPYGDMILCYITGGVALIANIISIALGFANGSLTKGDLAMVEIQIAAIALGAFFTGLATSVIRKVNAQKLSELNDEKIKSETLLANTLELSKVISEDIDAISTRMEHFERSVTTTRDSMQDVSSGANETAEAMQTQLMQTETIVEQVSKAKEVSKVIADDIRETEDTIVIGKENVDNLLSFVNQSEKASATVVSSMNELTENTDKMNSIVEIINSITKQTSMLSLNASIEAARAGESGKGFAVVAEEISTLAKQTSEATVNITNLITNISDSINEVFTAINQLMESNKEQNQSAETMAQNFEKIEVCSRNIYEVSDDLEKVIDELVKSNAAIVENINTVSAVTQEVSARASETLTGSENDAVVVEEISKVITELNERAKQLNQ